MMNNELTEATYRTCFGFFIFSVLSIWLGIYYLNTFYEFAHIDATAYLVSKVVLSVMLLLFAAYTLIDGTINEGIVLISFGLSTLTFALCNLAGMPGMNELDIILATAMFIASIMFFLRRNYMLFAGTLIMSLTMSVPYILANYVDLGASLGVGLIIGGLIYGYFSIGGFIYMMMGKNILHITNDRFGGCRGRAQTTYEMIASVGYYLFGVAWCIYMQVPLSATYDYTMIAIASVILVISVVSIYRGAVAEGVMLSVGSMLMIMEILCDGIYGAEVPGIFYLFMGVGTLFLVTLFYAKGDHVIMVAALIIALMYILWAFTSEYDGIVLVLGWIPGIIILYYSLSNWIIVERRIAYLPTFRRKPKRFIENDDSDSDN